MKQTIGLTQGLQLRQNLVLSPQMVQQMNLLVLPLLDFNAEIETLADDNPVLDVHAPADPAPADTAAEVKEQKGNDEWDEGTLQRIAELGEEPSAGSGSWAGGTSGRHDEEFTDPILRVAPTKTLTEDLLEQVRLGLSGPEEKIGEFLVQDIDSRGFLTRSPEDLAPDIAAWTEHPVTVAEVAAVLDHLKSILEPPGILAANVEESIALQLKRQHKSKWVDLIVSGYRLLAASKERELDRLCSREGVEPSFVYRELEKLHFVPTFGVADQAFDANSVRPELIIARTYPDRHGPEKYEVRYNSTAVVTLSLNPKIIDMARRRSSLSRDEKVFLREKIQKAKWLKQIVDDRRSLLLRTGEAVVQRQWEFLDKGRRYLRPLTQREIAEEVGRDESTISRLINGRFAETPQGTLPLSAFFSAAVGHASGAAAREILKEIMDEETTDNTYTDDELADMMRQRGFAIQRRTINKYRRMLGGQYALKRSVRRALNRMNKVG